MTKPITAKGFIRNEFVVRSEKYPIIDDTECTEPKRYVYCGESCVARLKTEKSAIKLANDLNSSLKGIS
ncbi:MAG: hypothetical protein QNJ74_11120 [Trichodesmium sp. MO_231.B1]|nr:hypothetical protein [Trichodesmium sp. MO_231.B1]